MGERLSTKDTKDTKDAKGKGREDHGSNIIGREIGENRFLGFSSAVAGSAMDSLCVGGFNAEARRRGELGEEALRKRKSGIRI
jgi:hypothetical protein